MSFDLYATTVLNVLMELTKLEVSFRAADKVACLPLLPTVMAPAGGELSANALMAKLAQRKNS